MPLIKLVVQIVELLLHVLNVIMDWNMSKWALWPICEQDWVLLIDILLIEHYTAAVVLICGKRLMANRLVYMWVVVSALLQISSRTASNEWVWPWFGVWHKHYRLVLSILIMINHLLKSRFLTIRRSLLYQGTLKNFFSNFIVIQ